jgi:threonine aldolase
MIDLRSDTLTKPTPGMRQAIAKAEVGDDCYGEDPTVKELETRVAALVGKEAALFTPTGTMSNQLAVILHTGAGDEILADHGCHLYNFEGGAPAALAGVQIQPVVTAHGVFTASMLRERVRPQGDMHPRTRLVWMENTNNRAGGTLWPIATMREVAAAARELGLRLHVDGARLWNAEAASGVPLKDFAACADTVSVCLSKGLGAPAGSLFCGSSELVTQARRVRRRLGGGLRQVGVLAAAGLYALEHQRARLKDDHDNARRLGESLAKLRGIDIDLETVQTNMVMMKVSVDAAAFAAKLAQAGVLANAVSRDTLRLVTHLDVSRADIDEAVKRVGAALG